MGWSVVKQPNGKYALFSTISEACFAIDCDEADIEEIYYEDAVAKARRDAKEFARQGVARANGEKGPEPYVTDVPLQVKLWRRAQSVSMDDDWLGKVCAAFGIDVPPPWDPEGSEDSA